MDDYDEYEDLRRALSPNAHLEQHEQHVERQNFDPTPRYHLPEEELGQTYSDQEDSFDPETVKFDEKYDEERYDLEEEEEYKFEGGFGLPPATRQLRRNKTNRRVQLTKGNLVLDCLIPTRLAGFLPRKDADEFKYTR